MIDFLHFEKKGMQLHFTNYQQTSYLYNDKAYVSTELDYSDSWIAGVGVGLPDRLSILLSCFLVTHGVTGKVN